MRFLVDMCMDVRVARWLGSAGSSRTAPRGWIDALGRPRPRSPYPKQARTTPPSQRSAAPLVAEARGLHT